MTCRVPASILHAVALAGAGQFRQAISITNEIGDLIRASGNAGYPNYAADRALLREAVRCIQSEEAALPAAAPGPLEIEAPFRYIIGYPRSGNTLLVQFLSYAFAAPNYSVYPGAGRYFSRRFYERTPGHAVFVKDHVLSSDYLADEILSPVRDGRDSMVSLARYLHAEGSSPFIRQGELADLLSYVAERFPYGFWGDHTRRLLQARDDGARIRLVRYEEIFRNHPGLLALAGELAQGNPVPCTDQDGYLRFVAEWKRRLTNNPEWSETLTVPEDSFIPQNWKVGGGTIHWRRAFDARARPRFHDLGGTEMLVRLGYETDENWWRHE